MSKILIKKAFLVNEGRIQRGDVLIENDRIRGIDDNISIHLADDIIQAEGKYLIPGIIDDQVHFREPGLTHKANIFTESRAAIAGGVTSFMEMPNTKPAALTQELLAEKYAIGAQTSLANYSFFMGASNDNLAEVLKTNARDVCGIKIFMGSSTGNMLVDNRATLDQLFAEVKMIIATHCEDEATVRANEALYRKEYGDNVPMHCHPDIRSVEACYLSSSMAVELAKKHNTRLHILHISTAKELDLFRNDIPLKEKRITSELCVHHLFFNADDYAEKGSLIKCNPAIKSRENQAALLPALLDNRLDIIATDHAPHTSEEKAGTYFNAPSGLPLVQHSLTMMLDYYHRGEISLEKIIEKMCHAPADCFQIEKRGYLREGYFADMALVDINAPLTIQKNNLFYKCAWSPLEGRTFLGYTTDTFVSGHHAYHLGQFNEKRMGQRMLFER